MFLAHTLSRAGISGYECDTINIMKCLPISDEPLKQIQRETSGDSLCIFSLYVLTTVIRQG